jgi:hypothetical protein
MAEKEGFEPSIQFYPYTFLAGKRLRPLGHFSIGESWNIQKGCEYR